MSKKAAKTPATHSSTPMVPQIKRDLVFEDYVKPNGHIGQRRYWQVQEKP